MARTRRSASRRARAVSPTRAAIESIRRRWAAVEPAGGWALEVTSDAWYIGTQSGTEDPYDGGLPIVARAGRVVVYDRKDRHRPSLETADAIAAAPADIATLLEELDRRHELLRRCFTEFVYLGNRAADLRDDLERARQT